MSEVLLLQYSLEEFIQDWYYLFLKCLKNSLENPVEAEDFIFGMFWISNSFFLYNKCRMMQIFISFCIHLNCAVQQICVFYLSCQMY